MMNELTCEKAGNLFQVETIHFSSMGRRSGRITNED